MSISRHFVLAAGGTGGHMIPAHAVAEELMARGHHVALVTDERGAKIPGIFDKAPENRAQVHVMPAGRMTKNPASWPGALKAILAGTGDGPSAQRHVQADCRGRLWRLSRHACTAGRAGRRHTDRNP
ncbi:glycosyltransferase [Sphingobium scionense]